MSLGVSPAAVLGPWETSTVEAGSASSLALFDLEPGPCPLLSSASPLGEVDAREVFSKAGDWQAWGREENEFWGLPWVRRALRLIPSQGEAYKWGTK